MRNRKAPTIRQIISPKIRKVTKEIDNWINGKPFKYMNECRVSMENLPMALQLTQTHLSARGHLVALTDLEDAPTIAEGIYADIEKFVFVIPNWPAAMPNLKTIYAMTFVTPADAAAFSLIA